MIGELLPEGCTVSLVLKCLSSGDFVKEGGEHVKAWLLESPKVSTVSGGESRAS